jgi:ABC-type uncharacterized transport system permease subunit
MSAPTLAPGIEPVSVPRTRARSPLPRALIAAAGVIMVMSLVGHVANAPDFGSSGNFGAALRLAVPLLLAGLGGLFSERVGIVNIGLEGMMTFGTWFGGWAGWQWGPWAAIAGGIVGGALAGGLHALLTITIGVDHVVSGFAINIIALGVTRFLATKIFVGQEGASQSFGPAIKGTLGKFTMPFTSGGNFFGWKSPDPLGVIERHNWFFLSDLAGLIRGFTSDLSWLTVIAILLVPASAYVLWYTAFGLRMRSVGEKPTASDSLGVNVYLTRYIGVLISGGLAGLGGAYLVLQTSGRYQEGQVAGQGFIALAALIFGNWRPTGVALGAGLFGFALAVELRSDASVLALVLFVAILIGASAVWSAIQRKWVVAGVSAVIAAWFAWYYAVTDKVPTQFVYITPYAVTLLVLGFASQRLRPPAWDGKPWRKGQST